MIRVRLLITGKVQGVNFRYYTAQKATESGIKGWIRNLPSGEIEAILEGEEQAVNSLVDWCRQGPVIARVEEIEVEKEEYQGEFSKFEIKY